MCAEAFVSSMRGDAMPAVGVVECARYESAANNNASNASSVEAHNGRGMAREISE